MKIDEKTILRVAQISRINLKPEEIEKLLNDFQEILSAFSMLDEARTDNEPSFHPIEVKDYLREDEPAREIDSDDIIKQMDLQQRFIKGPRMQ